MLDDSVWLPLPLSVADKCLDLALLEMLARLERLKMESFLPSVVPAHDALVKLQRAVRHWIVQRRRRALPTPGKGVKMEALWHTLLCRTVVVAAVAIAAVAIGWAENIAFPSPTTPATLERLH